MLDICDRAKMSKILLNIMSTTKVLFFTILSFFIFSISSCDVVRDVLNQGVQDNASCIPPTNAEFQVSHNLVKSKTFDSDIKAAAIRETKNMGCITSTQAGLMARLHDFERGRLDYLKFAYNYCSDKNNYHQNLDLLDFNSS